MGHKVYMIYDSDTSGGVVDGQEDKEYADRENRHISFHATGLKLKAPAWSETIEVDFDPKGHDHLFVVIVKYGDGDTFGHTCGHWQVIGAYHDRKEAKKIAKSIENEKYDGYNPWRGYFACLENVEIETLDLN